LRAEAETKGKQRRWKNSTIGCNVSTIVVVVVVAVVVVVVVYHENLFLQIYNKANSK
jgi:hypothetical protein